MFSESEQTCIILISRCQPLAATCSHLAATCSVSHLAATCSHLAATCSVSRLAATCPVSHLQPLAATCSHLQPLAATCSHLPRQPLGTWQPLGSHLAATSPSAKWLQQVAAKWLPSGCKWLQVADGASGCQVAASG